MLEAQNETRLRRHKMQVSECYMYMYIHVHVYGEKLVSKAIYQLEVVGGLYSRCIVHTCTCTRVLKNPPQYGPCLYYTAKKRELTFGGYGTYYMYNVQCMVFIAPKHKGKMW